jgi:hypothetical protein
MNTRNLRTYAGSIIVGLITSQTAAAAGALWDADVNPTNGFGGLASTWGLTDADTIYAEWNVFDSLSDNTPDIGSFGPAPQSVTETTGASFLTSGGNIYSPFAATVFDVGVTGYSALEDTVRSLALRVATLGTGLDASSVLLNGSAATVTSQAYNEVITGGFGGGESEWLFIWEGVDDSLTYQFNFNAEETSLSVDQLAVYSSAASVVPIPAAAWLFGSALMGMGGLARRSKLSNGIQSLRNHLSIRSSNLMA